MIIKFPELQCKKDDADDAPKQPTDQRTIDVPRGVLGLSREESARYIGVSPSLFDQLVKDGRMPQPRMLNSRVVWDRLEIKAAFRALPHRNDGITQTDNNEWATAV
jgi:predicted DNA-binding transcriptional regulator AlpA